MVYLDYSATCPLDAEVAAAMSEAQLRWPGNPSSVHTAGRQARAALEQAKEELAAAFGAQGHQVVLTSSGSEANNLAVKGFVPPGDKASRHIIVGGIEHHSVLHAARWVAARDRRIALTELPANEAGRIESGSIAAALRPETRLVCLMAVNNETGMIQPVEEAAKAVADHPAWLHCDAVQAPGRLDLRFDKWGCDSMALAAHKFHGPRGAGALFIRRGRKLEPLIHGGSQQGGLRAGTESVALAIGMALAAKRSVACLGSTAKHCRILEREFIAILREAEPTLEFNGAFADKVAGVLNLSFPGVRGDDLTVGMDLAGFAIATGAACSSGVVEPSHVLKAMGLPDRRVNGAIRISFGSSTSDEDAGRAARALAVLAARLRQSAAPSSAYKEA